MNDKTKLYVYGLCAAIWLAGCGDPTQPVHEVTEQSDPADECALCTQGKADAFGIERESYLAYGILELANTASFEVLDDDVMLDKRAASGIVAQRPFEFIEQLDTVSYVGRTAFERLADYARAKGFVPFCGDGELQSLIESCDDGNSTSGDGCSDMCMFDSLGPGSPLLEESNRVIKGSDIGLDVPYIKPNSYYLRERSWVESPRPGAFGVGAWWSDDLIAVMKRADGINATESPNRKVSYDELAILSQSPFYDALLPSERATLEELWAIFEIDVQPAVTASNPTLSFDFYHFEQRIERPGRLLVTPTSFEGIFSDFSRLPGHSVPLLRRTQQMPGCDLDGDVTTLEVSDVDLILEDYQPVFTSSEVATLRMYKDHMVSNATELESQGEFSIVFDDTPTSEHVYIPVAALDDYEFFYNQQRSLHYYARDTFLDGHLEQEVIYDLKVRYTGTNCASSEGCVAGLHHDEISLVPISDDYANIQRGERFEGVFLMEHWSNGQRVYARLLNIASNLEWEASTAWGSGRHDFHFTATPVMSDGTSLILTQIQKEEGVRTFALEPSSGSAPEVFERIWTQDHRYMMSSMRPGRYEVFEGFSLDVHPSGAIIAYSTQSSEPCLFEIKDKEMLSSCDGASLRVNQTPNRSTFMFHVTTAQGTKSVAVGVQSDEYNRDESFYTSVR